VPATTQTRPAPSHTSQSRSTVGGWGAGRWLPPRIRRTRRRQGPAGRGAGLGAGLRCERRRLSVRLPRAGEDFIRGTSASTVILPSFVPLTGVYTLFHVCRQVLGALARRVPPAARPPGPVSPAARPATCAQVHARDGGGQQEAHLGRSRQQRRKLLLRLQWRRRERLP
jgi:hypothetical protein